MATVRIPQPLQNLTEGQAEVQAEGATAREILDNLETRHTGLRTRVLDDEGKLRRFVNLYLNDEDIRFLQNLDTPVATGDKLSIVPAIAGGSGGGWRVRPGDPANQKKNSI